MTLAQGTSGSGITMTGPDLSLSGTVTVLTSSTGSSTVTLSAAGPANFAVGSTLLGQVVTGVSGVNVTLSGNANATIAAATAQTFGNGLTISAPLVLGVSQTWTNNSPNVQICTSPWAEASKFRMRQKFRLLRNRHD